MASYAEHSLNAPGSAAEVIETAAIFQFLELRGESFFAIDAAAWLPECVAQFNGAGGHGVQAGLWTFGEVDDRVETCGGHNAALKRKGYYCSVG